MRNNERIIKKIHITGIEKRKRKLSSKTKQVVSDSLMNDVAELKADFREISVIMVSEYRSWDSGDITFTDLFPFNSTIIYKKQA